jgi:CheY-like chemotaxis protein
VLVADDHVDAATSFCYLLQVLGCRTAVAFDGATAVRLLAMFKPQLSLIDLDMPVLDGLATVALLRAADPDRQQLIVCLSGRCEPEDGARCLRTNGRGWNESASPSKRQPSQRANRHVAAQVPVVLFDHRDAGA